MSYHLFIVACAGAGATVIALVSNSGPRPGLARLPTLQALMPNWPSSNTPPGRSLGSTSPVETWPRAGVRAVLVACLSPEYG